MKCSACGLDFKRAALLALAIAFGAKTSDPNYCNETENNEHDWKESSKGTDDPPIVGT